MDYNEAVGASQAWAAAECRFTDMCRTVRNCDRGQTGKCKCVIADISDTCRNRNLGQILAPSKGGVPDDADAVGNRNRSEGHKEHRV